MSRKQFESFMAQTPFSDSISVVKNDTFHWVTYLPVNFEGQQSRLRVFIEDSTMIYTISIPRRGKATQEDFSKLHRALAEEIGEPSVYMDNYLDYLHGSGQPIFAGLKDGTIMLTVIPSSTNLSWK